MDTSKKYENPNPQIEANPLSRLFFCWMIPFLKRTRKYDFEMQDIYNTMETEMSKNLTDRLERNWEMVCKEAEIKNIKPSLKTAIRKTFLRPFFICALIDFIRLVCLTYGMPTALAAFINYFSEVPRDPKRGWYLGATVILIQFFNSATNQNCRLYFKRIGIRIRISCGALIYRKIMKLNKTSLDNTDVGNIVNLLSNDLLRFEVATELFSHLWIMPVIASLGTYVMYMNVGPAAFIGVGAMVIQAVPFQGYLSKLQGKFRSKIAEKTDKRVKLMNEITAGIRVIKMYAWEKPFEKVVSMLRQEEVRVITHTSYIKSIAAATQVFTERLTLYIVVLVYVLMGHELTGGIVFSMSQLINTLQLTVCILFPMAMAKFAEAKASVVRVEEFLLKEERKVPKNDLEQVVSEAGMVELTRVHASWTPNSKTETLTDVSLSLAPGSFCCIVGNVGSGKSSILQLLLGDLSITSGKIQTGGKISYASQEPWLFVSNIRNNILFGQPFVKDKYDSVVQACALERDFELFPFGDKTLVGEKGVSLSGGQKARINLARAIYRDADIYLLDDPLSAVDPHVSKHLMGECIKKYLKNKTRILVTHQTQFVNQADFVLVLNNGKIENTFKASDLGKHELKLSRVTNSVETQEEYKSSEGLQKTVHSLKPTDNTTEEEESSEEPKESQELMEKGKIGFSVFKEYYTAGANISVLILEVLLLITGQVLCSGCDIWITFWTNNVAKLRTSAEYNLTKSEVLNLTEPSSGTTSRSIPTKLIDSTSSDTPYIFPVFRETSTEYSNIFEKLSQTFLTENLNQDIYIQVYTLLIISAIVLTVLRSAVFYRICMTASKNLHNWMFTNVLQAKMRFFDTNPSGRILNRFSKDMGVIDEILPTDSLTAFQTFAIGGGILVIVLIKSYYLVIPVVLLGIAVNMCRSVFLNAAQIVKRYEGMAKAPVFSYIAASLDGLPTIRSANAEDMVQTEFDNIQDEHTSTCHMFVYCFSAFGFYMDLIAILFLASIEIQFLLVPNALSGDVGLVISQSLIVLSVIQLGTRYFAEVANNMTSVERILQYTKLDKEGPFVSPAFYKPPPNWPEAGRITFSNVYLRYVVDEGPVLKNLNLEIEPGEKVGIVGRTGAGKSTLIAALFRLAPMDGTIQIDGVDTMKIGLTDLRRKISIIPQDPTLFSESIRYNLDPFAKSDDESLWKALEAVELKGAIESLDMNVTEGGSNFSAGQRQLLCLARAIVRNNRILVMDEATANVDPYTDAAIQKSIRANFAHCTVLTVAHRLNTIMDCDRVIVMDAGQMKEFAPPHELLQNSEGNFTSMLKETGEQMEKKLRKVAEEHYRSKGGVRRDLKNKENKNDD